MFNKPQIDKIINSKYSTWKGFYTIDDAEFPTIMCEKIFVYKTFKDIFGKQAVCCASLREVEMLRYQVNALKEKLEHPELYSKDDVLFSTREITELLPDIYEAIYFEGVKEWAQE